MTEQQVGIIIGALDRWIRNAINRRIDPTTKDGKWEDSEIAECKENIAAMLLGKQSTSDLPESLQYTSD